MDKEPVQLDESNAAEADCNNSVCKTGESQGKCKDSRGKSDVTEMFCSEMNTLLF